jgi:hypothetical protein
MSDFPRLSKKETAILVGIFVAFFLVPYLSAEVLILTDNFLVRIALLVGLILVAYMNPILAIAAFVLLALLFIKRNKAKVQMLSSTLAYNGSPSEAVASIETPATAPEQPPFDMPKESSVPFMPSTESGDNSFYPVAPSMNQKQPLPTETVDGSEKARHQLFEWVNPIHT